MNRARRLLLVKLVHTAVWVVVAGAVFALFPAIAFDRPGLFARLHLVIVAEILVLVAFRWTCPLRHIAARYTDDRSVNFDIFLPDVIARWNKPIFTTILLVAWSWAAWRWLLP
ncbi:MAG: hypothetical protein ACFCGT_13280 [Sandaracinaceae bacterium]